MAAGGENYLMRRGLFGVGALCSGFLLMVTGALCVLGTCRDCRETWQITNGDAFFWETRRFRFAVESFIPDTFDGRLYTDRSRLVLHAGIWSSSWRLDLFLAAANVVPNLPATPVTAKIPFSPA
jgi:hypothetical protein